MPFILLQKDYSVWNHSFHPKKQFFYTTQKHFQTRFPSRLRYESWCFTEIISWFISKIPLISHPTLELFILIFVRKFHLKSRPFSNTLISVSVRIFLLRLKTVLEQKHPFKPPFFVMKHLLSEYFSEIEESLDTAVLF